MQQPISQAQLHKQSGIRGFILFAIAVVTAVLIVSSLLLDGRRSFQVFDAARVAGQQGARCVAMDKMTFEQLPQNLQMQLNGTCNQAVSIQP